MVFIQAFWKYLLISAPYLIFGLLLSGFIYAFISVERIKKAMGGESIGSVFKAALFGIPLPLCSCSVIPTAATLKKNGASNGATSSFLISTPESGVDSIAVTYAMMDLPMTILRPVAAFLSALVAGILQFLFNKDGGEKIEEVKSCCSKSKDEAKTERTSFGSKVAKMFSYAFNDLLDDMALWLTFGLIAGAVIEVLVPANFFETMGLTGQKLAILAVGIPLYICASATTPIAASLVLKGMSPGTALLILLVGPATNISNILVMQKYIGKKGIIINVLVIALVALGMSYFTDYLYSAYSFPIDFKVSLHEHGEGSAWWEIALAVVLSVSLLKGLIVNSSVRSFFKGFFKKDCCGG